MEVEIRLASAPNWKENVAISRAVVTLRHCKVVSFLQEKDCGVACALKGLPCVGPVWSLHESLHVIDHVNDVGVNGHDALTQT